LPPGEAVVAIAEGLANNGQFLGHQSKQECASGVT